MSNTDKDAIDGDFDCSVNIDNAAKPVQQPGDKLFDFVLVSRGTCDVHVVEIHSASSSSSIQYVIEKKEGTLRTMHRRGVDLSAARWHWASTPEGKPFFKASDKYGKRLAMAGISQPRRPVRL